MTYPLACPACNTDICEATLGQSESLRLLSRHFEYRHAVAPLLASELARSVILHRFGLLDTAEIDELLATACATSESPLQRRPED